MQPVCIAQTGAGAVHPSWLRQRKEMVPGEERIDASLLSIDPSIAKRSIAGMLRLNLHADPNLSQLDLLLPLASTHCGFR